VQTSFIFAIPAYALVIPFGGFPLNHFCSRFAKYRVGALALFAGLAASALHAQVVIVPSTPQVGSSNPVSAEPNVKRPPGTPCTVTLFSNEEFADYSQHSFSYTPTCSGPYSKIVLTGDFTVTAGRQFDRTAELYIGGANVYFGTTAEPRAALSPSWHVERDITDLTSLLASSQSGTAIIYNIVDSTYTGIIYGTVKLEFYPATPESLVLNKVLVPDQVVPLSANGQDQTLTLPKNIERAYLDVIAQSQSQDEFWYTNAPNDVASELEEYGNTGFREVEVSIDGTAAGLAPVYPWIYTGGIDPYLWEPIVGVQTLNFKPFRVNLTPFAGVLSDGKQHTVAVSVYNAASYFDVTAALLLYLDHGASQVTGAVTKNTLAAAPQPQVVENLKTDADGNVTGNVLVYSLRQFSLAGYVQTSHGKVETTVDETADFGNYQTYDIETTPDEFQYVQSVAQLNGAYSITHTKDGLLDLESDELFYYPFTVSYNFIEKPDGTYTQAAQAMQQNYFTQQEKLNGFTFYTKSDDETVNTQDNLGVGATVTHSGTSTASYQGSDSLGSCYSRSLAQTNGKLTSYKDGAACGGTNKP
jgi:hypothetical protein